MVKYRSNVAKGKLFQKEIVSWFKKYHPWAKVHNFESHPRKGKYGWYSGDNDLWNCVDIAINLSRKAKPLFIQATWHTAMGEKLKKLALVDWNLDCMSVHIWRRRLIGKTEEVAWVVMKIYREEDGTLNYKKIGEIRDGEYEGTERLFE